MIDNLISFSWEEPPPEMEFGQSYSDLLREIGLSLEECLSFGQQTNFWRRSENRAGIPQAVSSAANNLYLKTQAIINVALNYKICLEQGLPLHPTIYFEVGSARSGKDDFAGYSDREKEEAQALFLKSISLARQIYSLTLGCLEELDTYLKLLLPVLLEFVYTHKKDNYTWKASDPELVRALAEKIKEGGEVPHLVVGAAHGSILPGILLANLLGAELYFVRCSRFKRKDSTPVLSEGDQRYFKHFRNSIVLVFDEDVARGETLKGLAELLKPNFKEVITSSVIKHYLAPFSPNFIGRELYD